MSLGETSDGSGERIQFGLSLGIHGSRSLIAHGGLFGLAKRRQNPVWV
jgi:hypothetical protein